MTTIYKHIEYWCTHYSSHGFFPFTPSEVPVDMSLENMIESLRAAPRMNGKDPYVAISYKVIFPEKRSNEWLTGTAVGFYTAESLILMETPRSIWDLLSAFHQEISENSDVFTLYEGYPLLGLVRSWADTIPLFARKSSLHRKMLSSVFALHTPNAIPALKESDYWDALFTDEEEQMYPNTAIIIARNYLGKSLSPKMIVEDPLDIYTGWLLRDAYTILQTDYSYREFEENSDALPPEQAIQEVIDCVNAYSRYISLLFYKKSILRESREVSLTE